MSSLSAADLPAEHITTVVIGAGLPGLAVASELSRQGVSSIVVEGLLPQSSDPGSRRTALADSASLSQRNDLLRLLQAYASSHCLDIRRSTVAREVMCHSANPAASDRAGEPPAAPGTGRERNQKWIIRTDGSVLIADSVVLAGCAQNQMRRLARNLGIPGGNPAAALQAIGMHLVGVAGLLSPTTREIIRQAKVAGEAIAANCPPAAA